MLHNIFKNPTGTGYEAIKENNLPEPSYVPLKPEVGYQQQDREAYTNPQPSTTIKGFKP
jgi:hypothetical protein